MPLGGCFRTALIYFVIADLAAIDPMYQYSLSYFSKLFGTCIDDAEKSTDLNKRLATLMYVWLVALVCVYHVDCPLMR
jgi:hypothetical protein